MEWQTSTANATGFTKEHIYAGQRRIAEVHTVTGQAAKVTHSHPDPSGSPAMLSDASGLVSARETYRPYGDKLLSPNTNESAGFANKAFDANTNLSYMSARYYSPTLGRFISPDPVHFVEGNVHSFNRYAYANDNPMRYIDPTGLLADAISGENKAETQKDEQVAGLIEKALSLAGRALGIGAAKDAAKQAGKGGVQKGATDPKAPLDPAKSVTPEIQFGRTQNQIDHATRHVSEKGFNVDAVKDGIKAELNKPDANLQLGLNKSSVVVDGTKFDFHAFKGLDGSINVGRITPP